MLSYKERLDLLEQDLESTPPAFTMASDLPFAILRCDPTHPDEWMRGGGADDRSRQEDTDRQE